MKEFGILMIIFATLVFLAGLYMFTGHKIEILTGRPAYKNLNKNEWKNIGKYTMIVSVGIFILALLLIIL